MAVLFSICASFLPANRLVAKEATRLEEVKDAPQNGKVKVQGTVVDNHGEPVPGASVVAVGTSKVAIADIDGNFVLEMPEAGKIEVSFMGYKPVTM